LNDIAAQGSRPSFCERWYESAVRVELNVDLGELPDEPKELYSIATTVNIACGGHAGDTASMKRALTLAAQTGARVTAHPSYADSEGFGRRPRFEAPDAVRDAVAQQCTRLAAIADTLGLAVRQVKPHGALYHDASRDADYAAALIDGCQQAIADLETIVGFPETALEDIVKARGIGFVREGFADRRYDEDWQLVPRSSPHALLVEAEACVTQAVSLARMGKVGTICIHGDTPHALTIGRAVRRALEREGLLVGR
jgi:5-oxoprolinase (ATP-hydrolysing) subunit A